MHMAERPVLMSIQWLNPLDGLFMCFHAIHFGWNGFDDVNAHIGAK